MPFYNQNELKSILNELQIRLDKKRGQCFLIDKNIVKIIVNSIELNKEEDIVLEIGPGLGTLSDFIIENGKKTILIDNDLKIIEFLYKHISNSYNLKVLLLSPLEEKQLENFNELQEDVIIINSDILKIHFKGVNKVIGNIPYNLSAPIIFHLLERWNFEKIILMVQREFADRLTAKPGDSQYSRLSAAVSLFLNIKKIHQVSNSCFFPKPRVDSTVIELQKNSSDPNIEEYLRHKEDYLEFLRGIFPYKNKNLRNCLIHFFNNNKNAIKKYHFLYDNIQNNSKSMIFPYFQKKLRTIAPQQLYFIMKYGLNGE